MMVASEDDLVAAVRDYAADVMGCSAAGIAEVSRFEGGNRHAVFRVSCLDASRGQRTVVVRVAYGADPDVRLQAQREAQVLGVVGGVAAPALYDFRQTSRWSKTPAMCIEFIAGDPRDLTSAAAADIERLGVALRWVHQRATVGLDQWLPQAGNLVSYAEGRLRSILSGVVWTRDPLPGTFQSRLRAAAGALERSFDAAAKAASFRASEPLALLHGDPASDNILWRPDPVLIDWEYARLGDPADEIAYLFDQNELSSMQREAFWAGYQGSSPEVMERVTWWEPVTLLGSTLWWVERWIRRTDADAAGLADAGAPREPAYYLDRTMRRIERLEALMSRRG